MTTKVTKVKATEDSDLLSTSGRDGATKSEKEKSDPDEADSVQASIDNELSVVSEDADESGSREESEESEDDDSDEDDDFNEEGSSLSSSTTESIDDDDYFADEPIENLQAQEVSKQSIKDDSDSATDREDGCNPVEDDYSSEESSIPDEDVVEESESESEEEDDEEDTSENENPVEAQDFEDLVEPLKTEDSPDPIVTQNNSQSRMERTPNKYHTTSGYDSDGGTSVASRSNHSTDSRLSLDGQNRRKPQRKHAALDYDSDDGGRSVASRSNHSTESRLSRNDILRQLPPATTLGYDSDEGGRSLASRSNHSTDSRLRSRPIPPRNQSGAYGRGGLSASKSMPVTKAPLKKDTAKKHYPSGYDSDEGNRSLASRSNHSTDSKLGSKLVSAKNQSGMTGRNITATKSMPVKVPLKKHPSKKITLSGYDSDEGNRSFADTIDSQMCKTPEASAKHPPRNQSGIKGRGITPSKSMPVKVPLKKHPSKKITSSGYDSDEGNRSIADTIDSQIHKTPSKHKPLNQSGTKGRVIIPSKSMPLKKHPPNKKIPSGNSSVDGGKSVASADSKLKKAPPKNQSGVKGRGVTKSNSLPALNGGKKLTPLEASLAARSKRNLSTKTNPKSISVAKDDHDDKSEMSSISASNHVTKNPKPSKTKSEARSYLQDRTIAVPDISSSIMMPSHMRDSDSSLGDRQSPPERSVTRTNSSSGHTYGRAGKIKFQSRVPIKRNHSDHGARKDVDPNLQLRLIPKTTALKDSGLRGTPKPLGTPLGTRREMAERSRERSRSAERRELIAKHIDVLD